MPYDGPMAGYERILIDDPAAGGRRTALNRSDERGLRYHFEQLIQKSRAEALSERERRFADDREKESDGKD